MRYFASVIFCECVAILKGFIFLDRLELTLNFEFGKETQAFAPHRFVSCRIAFRFEEVREVVHILGKDSDANVPRPSQLSLNYRSHSGIVALGAAVVALLRDHFGVDYMAKAEVAALEGSGRLCMLAYKKAIELVCQLLLHMLKC